MATVMSGNLEKILCILKQRYHIRLVTKDPFQVLISTVLSQRTRDEKTDEATQRLFARYPSVENLAQADVTLLMDLIYPVSFFRQKAGTIKEISRVILKEYGGRVPRNLYSLLHLPGVGRKTANCVLLYGYGMDALPVDTHVHRVANRLGIVSTRKPEETEESLRELVPKKLWEGINSLFISFGKEICKPVHPQCGHCPMGAFCPKHPKY